MSELDSTIIQLLDNKTGRELGILQTIPNIGHGVVIGKLMYRVKDVVHHRYLSTPYRRMQNEVRVYIEKSRKMK